MIKNKKLCGFTLVEVLIYIGILAITGTFLSGILFNATKIKGRQTAVIEVNSQLNFALQNIQRSIMDSSIIDIEGGTSTSTLILKFKDNTKNPTEIYISGGVLYKKEATNTAQPLTTDSVVADAISFLKVSGYTGHDSVSIDLTLSYNTGNSTQSFSRTISSAIARVSAATFDSNLIPGVTSVYDIGTTALTWNNVYINGSVGIGNTAPLSKLGVTGSASIGATYGIIAAPTSGIIIEGNVGIGTTTPWGLLSVNPNAIGTAPAFVIGSSTATNLIVTNAGNVGIGTTSPRTKLELNGDGAILAIGTWNTGWTEPNLGAGLRMLWYPKKGAFRAGEVTGTQWNDANIGNWSIAVGYNTTASGSGSIAMGQTTTASMQNSVATGQSVVASGTESVAMGLFTTASGETSTALGKWITAGTAANTIVLGQGVDDSNRLINNTASSLMIGFNSTIPTLFVGTSAGAGTTGNVGIGTTTPWGLLSVNPNAIGTAPAFVIGSSTATNLIVTNAGNVGIGTTGPNYKLDVNGTISVSKIKILDVKSNPYDGSSMGKIDFGTGAGGEWASIEVTRVGTHNDDNSQMLFRTSNYVGGEEINQERMRITKEGNVGIGTTNPGAHKLSVVGTAGLSTGTAWTNTSDQRWKDVYSELKGESLNKIMALRPVSYKWNALHNSQFGANPGLKYGFIAQEVKNVIPEMISQDDKGYYWYNPTGIEAILTGAIQEQQKQIEDLKTEISELKLKIK